jgi:uncharacterized protein (DUF58 family)
MTLGVRPLVRTVVLGIMGLIFIIIGHRMASGPLVAGAGVVVLAVIIDGVVFLLTSTRFSLESCERRIEPHPCFLGHDQLVRLTNTLAPGRDYSGVEEWLPDDLSGAVEVIPRSERNPGSILEYVIHPPKRGTWVIGPASLRHYSGLGLWSRRITSDQTSEIIVWPQIRALNIFVQAHDRQAVMGHTTFAQPHQDNVTVRPYAAGDDVRRVHWRSSAHQGELMTRAEEPTDGDRAWVGVHVATHALDEVREVVLSLAASWIVELTQAGFEVDLDCAGELHRRSSTHQLTRLAEVTTEDLSRDLSTTSVAGVPMMFLAGDDPISADIHTSGGSGSFAGSMAVVWSGSSDLADRLRKLGWSVLELSSESSLDDSAEQLSEFARSMLVVLQ